jgi:alpha-beta hydrolase superfamily lysophospholipase
MSTKKRILMILAIFLSVCIVVFLAGPRIKVDTELYPVHLPADLDEYLARSEARYADIIPGTEKSIVWANAANKQKTKYAIIFVHGFSATRQEIAPACNILAEKIKANLFYTRLRGHGRDVEAMSSATANEWMNDVVEAVAIAKRLGEKVIYIGNSTGATLAVWAALHADLRENIDGLVLISPNFYPANPMVGFTRLPWGLQIGRAVMGDYREWKPRNAMEERYWTYRYRIEVLYNMMGLVDLVEDLNLSEMKIPVLVIHSDRDKVISVKRLKERYQEIGSKMKRRVTVNNTQDEWGHILAGDILSPKTTGTVVTHIMDFFRFHNKAALF